MLLGYSQGALVVRTMLRNLARTPHGRDVLDHLAGVVLVGDPTANPREHITHLGGSRGAGILAARVPLPRTLVRRGLVTSLCTADDPVCSSTPKSRRGKPSRATGTPMPRREQHRPRVPPRCRFRWADLPKGAAGKVGVRTNYTSCSSTKVGGSAHGKRA